ELEQLERFNLAAVEVGPQTADAEERGDAKGVAGQRIGLDVGDVSVQGRIVQNGERNDRRGKGAEAAPKESSPASQLFSAAPDGSHRARVRHDRCLLIF